MIEIVKHRISTSYLVEFYRKITRKNIYRKMSFRICTTIFFGLFPIRYISMNN
jgi:hypothetical protein